MEESGGEGGACSPDRDIGDAGGSGGLPRGDPADGAEDGLDREGGARARGRVGGLRWGGGIFGAGGKNFAWKSAAFWAGVDAMEPSLPVRSGVRAEEGLLVGSSAYFAAFQMLPRGRVVTYSLQCARFSRRMALWYSFLAARMAAQLGWAGSSLTMARWAVLYAARSADNALHHHRFVYGEGRLRGT